jgi:hypothetical protein
MSTATEKRLPQPHTIALKKPIMPATINLDDLAPEQRKAIGVRKPRET